MSRKRDHETLRSAHAYHEVAVAWRFTSRWVPRVLFVVVVLISASLLGLVVLAPWLAESAAGPGDGARVLAIFAHDATLRRITIAVAIGLLATACIFFRHPFGTPYHRLPRVPPPRKDYGF